MKYGMFLLFALLALGSCTEIIQLDLNYSAARLVIEGNLSDQAAPYTVRLSETLNFAEPNDWPAVSGALVTIAENGGASDTLRETAPGWYTGSKIHGTPGKTYTLTVEYEGRRHTASSTMPFPVALDTAYTQELTVPGAGKRLVPVFEFEDPAGTPNYYRLVARRDGYPLPGFYPLDDQARDGKRIIRPLRSDRLDVESGQQILTELQCVDQRVYEYFYVLSEAAGQGLNQSPTPANPGGQFDTEALGYFSAYTVSTKPIDVP